MGSGDSIVTNADLRIAVALVVYRQSNSEICRTLNLLSTLDGGPYPVYIVVNEEHRVLHFHNSHVRVLLPGFNLGFCGGVNLAAREAVADGVTHLLLLNFDIHNLEPKVATRLSDAMRANNDCAYVSPAIMLWPEVNQVWYRGGVIVRPFWLTRHPGIGSAWSGLSGGVRRTGYFTGCCALMELDAFCSVDGFDEQLFMYYDEADLATRTAQKIGKYSYLLDEPLLAHEKPGRGFNANEAFYHARNSRVLLHRNERGFRLLVGRLGLTLSTPLQLCRCATPEIRAAYRRGRRVSITRLVALRQSTGHDRGE